MLTKDQQRAFDACVSGKNVFLTGEAGTGKSFVIEKVMEELKNKKILVCAPTGIAATNVGGTTIHKLLGLKEGAYSPEKKKIITRAKSKDNPLRLADVVIVDEISMCRIDLFDSLVLSLKKYKKKQLIVVGDFCQLPPVLSEDERAALEAIYGRPIRSGYAFESEYWTGFTSIALKEIMRQNDPEFIQNLNLARHGKSECIEYFNSHAAKEEVENGIFLSGRNKDVSDRNKEELDKLPGKEYVFKAKKVGERVASLAEEELKLKIGAKVMFLVNTDDYVNGDTGEVVKISDNAIWVKTKGQVVEVKKYTWQSFVYKVKGEKDKEEIEKVPVGTIKQFPLKLAYAITIHKSQGQTFDAVNLNPECWDSGQLYCALSRVRDIKKMWLSQEIRPEFLVTDEAVQIFYARFRPIEYVDIPVPLELKHYLEEAIRKWEVQRNAQV